MSQSNNTKAIESDIDYPVSDGAPEISVKDTRQKPAQEGSEKKIDALRKRVVALSVVSNFSVENQFQEEQQPELLQIVLEIAMFGKR